MINIVIADDHHLVRQGLCALIDKEPDLQVVGEAADGYEALDLCLQLAPHVLVADINMPRLDGIQTIDQLKANSTATKVLILSMYSDDILVRRAMLKGASGYLVKQAVTEELLLAIRASARGEVYLSPSINQKIVTNFLLNTETKETSKVDLLTPREREILQLITESYTNREIGCELSISVKTVEKHRASLMEKLDVHDITGLLRVAIKEKLVFIDN